MCEPATIMAVAAVAGAGMSAYGQYQQGQNAEKMANYNADLAEVKATDALSTGAIAEEKQRAQVRQIEGSQAAQMGASGGVVGAGSFGDILDQTAKFGELDSQTIRFNAAKQAWGFGTQAAADRLQGAIAAGNGRMGAMSTLLSSAPGIYKAGQMPGVNGATSGAGWWK